MNSGSVMDAFGMWLLHKKPLCVLQTVMCLNREWNKLTGDINSDDTCKNINNICNQWFLKIKEISDDTDTALHYNIRRVIKNDSIRMSGVNHNTVLKLRRCGLTREYACSIVRALQILYRQPWAIRKLTKAGPPEITIYFLKTLNSNLCATHGTRCNRTRRKICITNDYKFELSCRCRASITRLER